MPQAQNPTENTSTVGQAKDAIKETASNLMKSNPDHQEGSLTRNIEDQTSKIPSLFYLGLAVASMAVSFSLAASKERKGLANFVGLWAPSFMIMGLYNKIVKTHGSDSKHVLH